MSHGKAHTRFYRFLAKRNRRLLRQFLDFETPKDILLQKFKERKQQLMGT